MNKNSTSPLQNDFSPEENLKQLSLFDDNHTFSIKHPPLKKVSIIDGWIKEEKSIKEEVVTDRKVSTLQTYRKMLRPSSIPLKHHIHITFIPNNLIINQTDSDTGRQLINRQKRRPMSSTLRMVSQTFRQPTPFENCKQKSQHEFLKKRCGSKVSKKNLESGKLTIQSFIYPVLDKNFENPQKLIPNIGRIGYLVKQKRRQINSKQR